MQFTTGTLTRCAGGNHVEIPITIQGGPSGILKTSVDEFLNDPINSLEEARNAIIARLRSLRKESGAVTWVQTKAALENKTLQV